MEEDKPDIKQTPCIGGWLLFIGFGLFVNLFRLIFEIFPAELSVFSSGKWTALTNPGFKAYHPLWGPLISFDLIVCIIFIIMQLFLIYLFLSKKRMFVKLYVFVLIIIIVFGILEMLTANEILNTYTKEASEFFISVYNTMTIELFFNIIYSLIWIPYMFISKRVKRTFIFD